MNETKEVNNNVKEVTNLLNSSSLTLFFQKKMAKDILNRQLKKDGKIHKLLTFDFDRNQFRMVNKNNVAVMSAKRTAKRNVEELISKNKFKIENNKRDILRTKYNLLFEYYDVENYENIYKDTIEPREESNKKYQNHIDRLQNKKKDKVKKYQESYTNIRNQQEPYVIELKNEDNGSKNINKAENMRNYIEYQSELYNLSNNYHFENQQIDETAVKPM